MGGGGEGHPAPPHPFILQNCVVFDELTDTRMYLYVDVDWTRIHQYLKRLYLGAKFSVFFEGKTEN